MIRRGLHISWNASIRDILHQYKCIFLIPNLLRKPRRKLPHGSYLNRGSIGRYRKIMKKRKFKI